MDQVPVNSIPTEADHKWGVAVHEAGHAIMIGASGGQVADFHMHWVAPPHGLTGLVTRVESVPLSREAQIMVLFAGPLAECCFWCAHSHGSEPKSRLRRLETMAFDHADILPSFCDDAVTDRNDKEIVRTPISLIVDGRPIVFRQATSGFEGDVQTALAIAGREKIDVHQALIRTRHILNERSHWGKLCRLVEHAQQAPERTVKANELLAHPERRRLVEHFTGQPDREPDHRCAAGNDYNRLIQGQSFSPTTRKAPATS